MVTGMWIGHLNYLQTNQKALSSLAKFYHRRAISPYLLSHSRKIPGRWVDNEHGSLEITNAAIDNSSLPQLETKQQWLAWLRRTTTN